MDLSTKYLGLDLSSPLVVGASPLGHSVDNAKKAEDAGAAMFTMHSLFEEEIESVELDMFQGVGGGAEANMGPDQYLEQLKKLKDSLDIPVVASLNGTTAGGWVSNAKLMQEAGADAVELNIYHIPTDPMETPDAVEERYIDIMLAIKDAVSIPFALKLSPFFSSLVYTAKRFETGGAAGLVVFNRFYQPDIDINEKKVVPSVRLSNPDELRLRLRWLAALFGHVNCDLAATGGIHSGTDVIKAVMAGASITQMTSVLLSNGPEYLATIKSEMVRWLEESEHESIYQLLGCMSLKRCPVPRQYERLNYMKVLHGWKKG